MNTISKQIGFDYDKSKALDEQIIKGEKYRFTVLSDILIRMEYSETGIFEDRPTLLASNRIFPNFKFNVTENETKLIIQTKYFKLTYKKNKPFKGTMLLPDSNLKVELLNTNKIWHYNHPEIRNYGAPLKVLADKKGKISFGKGLYSSDGFVCLNDSKTGIVLQNGDVEQRSKDTLDLYLFMYLNDFGACLTNYFKLTGYPVMLPRFALGNWWSRDINYTDENAYDLIKEFDENEIPVSLLLLNHDWHVSSYNNQNNIKSGFTFDLSKFTNPSSFINNLHSKNICLGLSIDPTSGIYPYENRYNEYKNFIKSNEEVIPFNAFSGQMYVAYFNFLIKPLLDMGVDAFWINNDDLTKEVQNVINIYHSANVMGLNKRIMLLTDNAMVAPHKYPILYSGNSIVNWNTLKKIPFHNLSATNIGVSWWSHDIGGFYKGIEDNELYTRFVQLGVFSPIFKFGSAGGKYYKREPWLWEVKTYRIVKDYLQLRHRLIPYLYTEMYKYSRSGIPIIKPLYYKTPKMYDDNMYRNEYYFGSEIFVAPIINKKDNDMNRVIHRFYLPEGIWYEFFSGKKFIGGRRYLYFVKDEDYPVFVKAGGIVPLSNNSLNDINVPQNMEIMLFPGQSNTYNLYEDDGITYNYQNGNFIVTSINYKYEKNHYNITVAPISGKVGIIPNTRNYKFRIRNTNEAENITVSINKIGSTYNTYLDENDLIVEVNNVPTNTSLEIDIMGQNINIETNRIINDEISSILNDLQIETEMKEKIDKIIFSDLPIKKKRINIRKLQRKGLEIRFMNLFLKLLEYVE